MVSDEGLWTWDKSKKQVESDPEELLLTTRLCDTILLSCDIINNDVIFIELC